MKKLLLVFVLFASFVLQASSQSWSEGFETTDTLTLPPGWSKVIRSNFPLLDTAADWNVRDTGRPLPGLTSSLSKSHSGLRAIGVSWNMGVDDTGAYHISDTWLITKRIHVWGENAYLSFWYAAGGGSASYRDSVQIWVSTVDSLPQNFSHYVMTISGTGPYGTFLQELVTFENYVGQDVWVAFRYYMDCSVDGFFVHLDDIELDNPVIGIKPIGTEIPNRFDLKQNYPNPFNPVTNIEFDLASAVNVKLLVYNSMGQEVAVLVNQDLKAGSYKYDFHAGNLPSGAYFYKLIAGDYVKTNKMILVK